MFKKVENELDLSKFNGVWTTVWKEKGYELEFCDTVLERFIVMTKEGDCVGTSEVKPYSYLNSPINAVAPFYENAKIIAAEGEVAEIDKIALLGSYRGKGQYLTDILTSAVYYAEQQGIKYFVSLLEPIFLRALKISFHIPLEMVGKKIYYKGDYVIPIIFDMAQMYSNKSQYDWLSYPPAINLKEQVEMR